MRDDFTSELDDVQVHVDQIPSISGTGDGSTVDPVNVEFDASSAIPSRPIRLYIDNVLDKTVTADSNGDYFGGIAPTTPLDPGTHTAYLVSVDAAGILSSHSDLITFDVAPPAPLFAQFDQDNSVNQATSPVRLTGFAPGATAAAVYEIDDNGDLQPLGNAAVSGGTATVPVTLTAGRHSVTASQTVGGVETIMDASPVVGVTVKTTPPTLDPAFVNAFTSDVYLDVSNGLDNFSGNGRTRFYVDGLLAGTEITQYGGDANLKVVAMADGVHTAYATSVDDTGHEGVPSNTITFTVTAFVPTPDPEGPQSGDAPAAPAPVVPAAKPLSVATPTPTPVEAATPAKPSAVKLSSSVLTAGKPVKLAFAVKKAGTVSVTVTRIGGSKDKKVATVKVQVKKAGKVSYTLRTKVGKRTLVKGRYKVTLRTVDGDESSAPVTQKLTVK